MGRLIDEDEVLKVLCRELCHPGARCPDGYCEEMREKLKDVPTVHPKPPKIGKWLRADDMYETFMCSICGYDTQDYIDYTYCPNCGAKMEGEDGAAD